MQSGMSLLSILTAGVLLAVACTGPQPTPTENATHRYNNKPLPLRSQRPPPRPLRRRPQALPLLHRQSLRPTATPATTPGPLSLAGSITDLSAEWIDPLSSRHYTYHARDEPPLVSKITVSRPDSEGIVSITGAPGAVPELAGRTGEDSIRIAAVEWGTQTCVRYDEDGSFSASLPAGDGTTIVLGATGAHCEGHVDRQPGVSIPSCPRRYRRPRRRCAVLHLEPTMVGDRTVGEHLTVH